MVLYIVGPNSLNRLKRLNRYSLTISESDIGVRSDIGDGQADGWRAIMPHAHAHKTGEKRLYTCGLKT